MKILFVHRYLPILGQFDARAHGFDAQPHDAYHVDSEAHPSVLRGLTFDRVVFVDIPPQDVPPGLLEAILVLVAGAASDAKDDPAPAPATRGLDIGDVRAALFAGKRVAREGWNGKRMYLELQVPDAHSKMTLPYVFMFTADGNRVPWLCSQTDLLADDWEVVPDAAAAPAPGPWHKPVPPAFFAKPLPPELDPSRMTASPTETERAVAMAAIRKVLGLIPA